MATRECPRTPKAGLGILRALLANGTSANVYNANGKTPLMIACGAMSLAAAEMLLANGADANMHDFDGNTAMHLAVAQGSPTPLLQLLIAGGADGSVTNQSGCTANNIARDNAFSEIVAVLNPCSPILSALTNCPDPSDCQLVEASAQYEPDYNAQGEVQADLSHAAVPTLAAILL